MQDQKGQDPSARGPHTRGPNNEELRNLFDELSTGLELLDGDHFKILAFARVAQILRDLAIDVGEFVRREPATAKARLRAIPGIGDGAAKRILEYVSTGTLAEHQKLLGEVPKSLFALLQVPGLGPKTVRLLWREFGIISAQQLLAAIEDGSLERAPRLGPKSLANLLSSLKAAAPAADARTPIGKALPLARQIIGELSDTPGLRSIDLAGSVRRGRDTIGDLDFVAVTRRPKDLQEAFTALAGTERVLASGPTKSSIRLRRGTIELQADLRIVPAAAHGSAMLYFTGSKEHNVWLRELAIERGLHLNEYGLFRGLEERPQDHGIKPVTSRTEAAIYRRLGLPYVPPELRETRARVNIPKDLIEVGDLRAELHAHTDASDGKLTMRELAAAVMARGFHTLAITDHSPAAGIARGLPADRLRRHVRAIRRLNEELPDLQLLAGAEVDILADGSLDYDDAVLRSLDLVVASPHVALRQPRREATRRLARAVGHPLVDILGHPSGRKLGGRSGLDFDIEEVSRIAAANGTALEINANPSRLDLRDTHVAVALAAGCHIAVNTDTHRAADLDLLEYGVLVARRAALPKSECVNAWAASSIRAWLSQRRAGSTSGNG